MASTESGGGNRLWSPARGKGSAPHRPTLASSIVAALVAMGAVLTFVLIRTDGTTSPSVRSIPTSSLPDMPGTSSPGPGDTLPAPATTKPSSGATVGGQQGGPAPCSAAEVEIVTNTDKAWYLPGSSVTVTTVLRAAHRCLFTPAAVAPYGCPTTVVVDDALGHQVWPWPGQSEVCSSTASKVLDPGVTEIITATWNGQVPASGGSADAPAGSYRALSTWAWTGTTGEVQRSARSQPFAVS